MAAGEIWPGCLLHRIPSGQRCCWCQPQIFYPQSTFTWPLSPPSPAPSGWQCPACLHVMAPFMTTCPWCPSQAEPAAEGAPAISLPADMASPGHVLYQRVSDEWAEVLPGLQCRLQSPGDMLIMYRATPQEPREPADA